MPGRFPLELTGLTKTFQTDDGPFVAVKNVNVIVRDGEFVCVIGHSGCGKSTVLSNIAGLHLAAASSTGPKEMPRAPTARSSFSHPAAAVAHRAIERGARDETGPAPLPLRRCAATDHPDHYLDLVGVAGSANQLPGELSLGTQQCVSLARALSREPRFLLLDDPFSMLDSLTRFALQDTLLEAWDRNRKTVVMVTHDVDEALYLADRLILMTDGPAATVGEVLAVRFPRPRERAAVLEHPDYYGCHQQVIDVLENHARQSRVA